MQIRPLVLYLDICTENTSASRKDVLVSFRYFSYWIHICTVRLKEVKEKSKEKERENKRRADPSRNAGDEKAEKRPRRSDDDPKRDDDVVMVTPPHRPAIARSGLPRNSLMPSNSDRDGRSGRSGYGDSRRPPSTQYAARHERSDRRR